MSETERARANERKEICIYTCKCKTMYDAIMLLPRKIIEMFLILR